jgi:hypothetical protein
MTVPGYEFDKQRVFLDVEKNTSSIFGYEPVCLNQEGGVLLTTLWDSKA